VLQVSKPLALRPSVMFEMCCHFLTSSCGICFSYSASNYRNKGFWGSKGPTRGVNPARRLTPPIARRNDWRSANLVLTLLTVGSRAGPGLRNDLAGSVARRPRRSHWVAAVGARIRRRGGSHPGWTHVWSVPQHLTATRRQWQRKTCPSLEHTYEQDVKRCATRTNIRTAGPPGRGAVPGLAGEPHSVSRRISGPGCEAGACPRGHLQGALSGRCRVGRPAMAVAITHGGRCA
jgi:hypothetical protein